MEKMMNVLPIELAWMLWYLSCSALSYGVVLADMFSNEDILRDYKKHTSMKITVTTTAVVFSMFGPVSLLCVILLLGLQNGARWKS